MSRARERSERGAAAPRSDGGGAVAPKRNRWRIRGEKRSGRVEERQRAEQGGTEGGEEGITQLHVGLMPGSLSLSA